MDQWGCGVMSGLNRYCTCNVVSDNIPLTFEKVFTAFVQLHLWREIGRMHYTALAVEAYVPISSHPYSFAFSSTFHQAGFKRRRDGTYGCAGSLEEVWGGRPCKFGNTFCGPSFSLCIQTKLLANFLNDVLADCDGIAIADNHNGYLASVTVSDGAGDGLNGFSIRSLWCAGNISKHHLKHIIHVVQKPTNRFTLFNEGFDSLTHCDKRRDKASNFNSENRQACATKSDACLGVSLKGDTQPIKDRGDSADGYKFVGLVNDAEYRTLINRRQIRRHPIPLYAQLASSLVGFSAGSKTA